MDLEVGPDLAPPQQQAGPDVAPPQQQAGPDVAAPQQQAGHDVAPPQQQAGPDVAPPQQQAGPDVAPPQQQAGPDVAPPQQQAGPDVAPPQQQAGPDVAPPQQQAGPDVAPPQQQAGPDVACSRPRFTPSWSTLSREDVVDKVKGTIYGQAIGDAIGLATEFMSKEQAKKAYRDGPRGYEDIVQDGHRSRWEKSDWTDDTDQMLLILMSIVDHSGNVDGIDFAKRLYNWMEHGFPEFGDYGGMGIGMTVHNTLTHPEFREDPHKAAKEVWESSGCTLAANGAIMRTSILGVLDFNDLDKVIKNTVEISAVTHADPRCSASCVAVTTALSLMLQGKYDPMKKGDNKALVEQSLQYASKYLPNEQQQEEMYRHVRSTMKKLKLDEKSSIGYTFKALGAGFYGLRKATDFRKTIMKLIMEGGDADTNGAVCGALMGCKFGFKGLPQDLLQFKHRQWLDDKVDSLLRLMGLM